MERDGVDAGPAEDPGSELVDDARPLGEGNEPTRRHAAPLGVVPPGESFDFDDPAGSELHDRLIRNMERAGCETPAKVGRERAVVVPVTRFAVGVVEAQTPAARSYGVAQRSLRLVEQPADRLAVGSPRRADTHREGHERPRDVDRLADQTFDPAGDGDRFVAVLNGAAHREAIAVEADDEIVAPDRGRQPARDLDQDRIARRRTETGVHEIEVVDVEQDDDRRLPAGDGIEVVQQRDSSREPGQIVAVSVGRS